MDVQYDHILVTDANRNFYHHVKNFCTIERPPLFHVMSLMPGEDDAAVAGIR